MSDYRRDPDDDFTRLLTALRERKQEITTGVMSGSMTPEQYATNTGMAAMIDEAIALVRTIRRGEDINPPRQQVSTAISPEDR